MFRLEDVLRWRAASTPGRKALYSSSSGWLDYGAFAALVLTLRQELRARGIRRNSRVAIVSTNRPALAVLYYATWAVGATVCPLSYRLLAADVSQQLEVLGPDLIVAGETETALVDGWTIDGILGAGDSVAWRTSGAEPGTGDDAPLPSGDPAAVIFTSGTTAAAKGVLVPHRGLAYNSVLVTPHLAFREGDVFSIATPLCHVGGLVRLLNAVHGGAGVIVEPRWSPSDWVPHVFRESVTHTMLVGPMIQDVARLDRADVRRLSSLRVVYYGAGRTDQSLLISAARSLPDVGWLQGYGQTETSGSVTLLTKEDHRSAFAGETDLLSSAGRPMIGAAVSVENAGGEGRGEADDASGEVVIRGDALMLGYLPTSAGQPVIAPDEIRTGDLGYFAESGHLFIVDRLSDVIVTGGLNVSAFQVEEAIRTHPDVVDVAVVGVPDIAFGSAVTAAVVPVPNATVSSAEIRDWATTRMSRHAVPKRIVFVDQLPRTVNGKVKKNDVVELVLASVGVRDHE